MNPSWNCWVTRRPERRILAALHTSISFERVVDILDPMAADERVQILFTCVPNPFSDGVEELVRKLGGKLLSWSEAINCRFDLVVAADYSELHRPIGRILLANHGAGFNKLVPLRGLSNPDSPRGVCGLDRNWLVHDGKLNASILLLSHSEQLLQLSQHCPEALPVAKVVGDPYYDQIVERMRNREELRSSLGLSRHEQLVLVLSTWGTDSLFGTEPQLLRRLIQELPRENYRVAAVLHPHVWQVHGEWQVRRWLQRLLDEGLVLVRYNNWIPALISSDCVVGDHGSLTVYATVTTKRILLGGRQSDQVVAAGSPMDDLTKVSPRISLDRPLRDQIDRVSRRCMPDALSRVAQRITSEPGRFRQNVLRTIYSILWLDNPKEITASFA